MPRAWSPSAVSLSALACAALLVTLSLVAPAGASTREALRDTQRELADARAGLDRARARSGVLTSDLDAYNARLRATQARITALSSRVDVVGAELNERRSELERTEGQLRVQRARALRLRARLAVARQRLADRLVELYQADRPDLVGVVLSADGFAELLEREHFLSRIAASDQSIIGQVRDARAQAAAQLGRLRPLQIAQRSQARRITLRYEQLAATRQQLVDARTGLRAVAEDRRRSLRRMRVKVDARASDVRMLAADQARLQRKLLTVQTVAAMPAGAGTGAMSWPVAGQVTSPFCESRAWEACHPGLDIAAPTGAPIRAAAAGEVILTQGEASSGGYGNFTCVQHSPTVTSCYAHQSRIATSVGARVGRGDVIGYVGSTGRSTGPHLHWEVRLHGTARSPLGFL